MKTRLLRLHLWIQNQAVWLVLFLGFCLGGCGEMMIGPHDATPFPTAPSTIPDLTAATTHPDYKVRLTAIAALGELGANAESAIPALISALTDNVSDVRIAAAYALRDVGPAAVSAVPELEKMLETDVSHGARRAAVEALGQVGDRRVVPTLAAILYDENESRSIMVAAAQAIAALTGNSFTDSQPGFGVRLADDGTPFLVLEVRSWWESEGQYQQWSDIDPEQE
jgi:HEAT repeat protein